MNKVTHLERGERRNFSSSERKGKLTPCKKGKQEPTMMRVDASRRELPRKEENMSSFKVPSDTDPEKRQ